MQLSITGRVKKYFWNLLISIDQLVNTIFGGDPDETISSRAGKDRKINKFAKILSRFLNWVDSNHVEKSREDDEGSNNSF